VGYFGENLFASVATLGWGYKFVAWLAGIQPILDATLSLLLIIVTSAAIFKEVKKRLKGS